MTEIIERVARALAGKRWDEFDEEHRQAARQLAREAIEAMREPTTDMIEQFEWHKPQEAARYYWDWMISVALGHPRSP